MSIFSPTTARQRDIALTILRLVVGVIFVAHGSQKLFTFGLAGTADAFAQGGIPLAGVIGPFVAFLEFTGGLALIFGLLTRLAAFGLGLTMVGAIIFVHLQSGFFLPDGFEFALSVLGGSAALSVMGGGSFSLDALIARRGGSATSTSLPARGRQVA